MVSIAQYINDQFGFQHNRLGLNVGVLFAFCVFFRWDLLLASDFCSLLRGGWQCTSLQSVVPCTCVFCSALMGTAIRLQELALFDAFVQAGHCVRAAKDQLPEALS